MTHSTQKFHEQFEDNFQKILNVEYDFQIFQIPDPRKSVLGPGDVFGRFLCPKIHQLIYSFVNFI